MNCAVVNRCLYHGFMGNPDRWGVPRNGEKESKRGMQSSGEIYQCGQHPDSLTHWCRYDRKCKASLRSFTSLELLPSVVLWFIYIWLMCEYNFLYVSVIWQWDFHPISETAQCQLSFALGNLEEYTFGTIGWIIFILIPAGSNHGILINLLTIYINPQNDPDNPIGCSAAQSQFTSDHLVALCPPRVAQKDHLL